MPTEAEVRERVAQRYEVQIEHAVRHLTEHDRKQAELRMLPVVEHLGASADGRAELAAILFTALMKERPETASGSESTAPSSDLSSDNIPNEENPASGGSRGDSGGSGPRRRRRRGPRSQ